MEGAFIQSQSGGFGRDFTNAKKNLEARKAHFEAEARLADVQAHTRRHEEILSKLEVAQRSGSFNSDTMTTELVARNLMFTGREEELLRLRSFLSPIIDSPQSRQRSASSPSLDSPFSGRQTRRTCLIHGLGGMGKSETALEYTYRYRSCYSHIFWLHAQSNATLTDSFLTIVRKLNLNRNEGPIDRQLENCLAWFESSGREFDPRAGRLPQANHI